MVLNYRTQMILSLCLLAVLVLAVFFYTRSQQADNDIYLNNVQFEPIKHTITRAAALDVSKKDLKIFLSTLESYHKKNSRDKTQLAIWSNNDKTIVKNIIYDSAELRVAAFSSKYTKWIFAGGLEPSLYSYETNTNHLKKLKIDLPWSGWIHGIGIYNDDIAVSASGLSISPHHRGIYKIDVVSGDVKYFQFPQAFQSTYSGVDTIDPASRVWFYTGYPYRAGWLTKDGKYTFRVINDRKGLSIHGWDDTISPRLTVSDERGKIKSLLINDFISMEPVRINGEIVFDEFIPVDIFNRTNGNTGYKLFYHAKDKYFISYNLDTREFKKIGSIPLYSPTISGMDGLPLEFPLIWKDQAGGDFVILGNVDAKIFAWRVGYKELYIFEPGGKGRRIENIRVENLTNASISAAVATNDGIFITGYLTHGEITQLKPDDMRTASLLPMKNLEGQIDVLQADNDGNIYGGAYPNAIIFLMNKDKNIDLTYKSKIIWRADSDMNHKHFQRVLSLSAGGATTIAAAIVKSDYSSIEETALVAVNFDDTVKIIKSNELFQKELIAVKLLADDTAVVLGRNLENKLEAVILSLDNRKILRKTTVSNYRSSRLGFLGEYSDGIYLYIDDKMYRIDSEGAKIMYDGMGENVTFLVLENRGIQVLQGDKLTCFFDTDKGVQLKSEFRNLQISDALINIMSKDYEYLYWQGRHFITNDSDLNEIKFKSTVTCE